jgi:DNA polymerase III subunit beta
MKVLCTTDNLKKGILSAEKIIGKNLTLPILSNILLEVEKGILKISATNLEIGIICHVRAKIEKEGKIAIPGKIIGSFMSNIIDNEKINLETKEQIFYLTYQGNKATIKGFDAKDFPIIPKPQNNPILEIESVDFQKNALKVLPCAATTETRQELTGIFMGFEKNNLVLAATDSFRLAEATIKLEKEHSTIEYQKYIAKNDSIIIPAKTIQEVVRSITPESGKLKIYIGENQIFFEVDDILFVSRLIDGKYPEYKQVVPKDFAANIELKREDLVKAVRVSSIFSDSKSREVKIKIKEGEKKIQVEAQSVEAGENITEVESKAEIKGSSVIAFNNRYLIDGLNSASTERIYIGFNDSFGPVVFQEIENGKIMEDYFHIVMPIRN